MLSKKAFEMQKLLQERPAAAGWATIERSPEAGEFKRCARLAAAEVAKLGECWEVDPANGAVHLPRAVVARMTRERTTAWAMVQSMSWEAFRAGLEAATRE